MGLWKRQAQMRALMAKRRGLQQSLIHPHKFHKARTLKAQQMAWTTLDSKAPERGAETVQEQVPQLHCNRLRSSMIILLGITMMKTKLARMRLLQNKVQLLIHSSGPADV